ncbi:helix-turn-helix transcriptional regulator [Pseudomonas lalucatii]|uniref:Helix-turn-helix transcriptional regulator n=1 Tax=Pseudomonas lalucatii TaxID=1424203 RepID=A0ABS5Q206_9PSED|nr:metalloregulator ArsR/SmtB family transcription factor [Pseudomonas lalucatii]MBS7662599.1 helix-turn-helix transcriptional regulator [Pseudomonas lalucatii]MBS7690185.1 helix-turn-helix transcriptional regulator [Pseudomonas lalucatii]MBS7725809.1 helix-turn-helix transcriptional regulator [Pseudomonas lalucatii]QVM88584.1 helix-turn-helix transcriptional regulator [Pseudomonas lalucatii]
MSEPMIAALAALAQGTRLQAFRLLVKSGPQGLSVGDLAAQLKVPLSTLSRHLGQLQQARLVRTWREGRHVLYATDWAGTGALLNYLTEDCCQGRADLNSLCDNSGDGQPCP